MIIKAGHIITSSGSVRAHPIKNLIVKPVRWKTLILSVNNSHITKICNNNQLINFEMKVNSNYDIILTVNDNIYHTDKSLFNYSIDIDIDESKYKLEDVVAILNNTIYDC